MLLAEALAARKDALTEVNALRDRLAAAVLRYEDQDAPPEDPAALVDHLSAALDRFESLTVRINRTNNAARLVFDGSDLTIMEAVARRERLTLEAKARRGALETVEGAIGAGRTSRGRWFAGRRTKDDLREIPTVELHAERRAANQISEAVRRLDLSLQQRNWTTDLVD